MEDIIFNVRLSRLIRTRRERPCLRGLQPAGFIQASMSKTSGTFPASSTVFKDLKLMKSTDLSVQILHQKC